MNERTARGPGYARILPLVKHMPVDDIMVACAIHLNIWTYGTTERIGR